MIVNSAFHKIDKPTGRLEYLIFSIFLFCIKAITKFIYKTFAHMGTNAVLTYSINFICCILLIILLYLTFATITKRLWAITGNKNISVIIAGCMYISAIIGAVIFQPLLAIWFGFVIALFIIPNKKEKGNIPESDKNAE